MLEGITTALFALFMVGLVLFLAWACTRGVGKGVLLRGYGGASRRLKVLERVALDREASLALVEICGRGYLLGVGPSEVTMLAQFTREELTGMALQEEGDETASGFHDILKRFGAGKGKSDGLQ